MRIVVAANITPFLHGGADYHIEGLTRALQEAGHEVVCLRLPFNYHRPGDIGALMTFCDGLDLERPNGIPVDTLISLQFPVYGAVHPNHRTWIMHQHRGAYELFDPATASTEDQAVRAHILAFDNRVLGRIRHRFANSARVAERLRHFNGLEAQPLFHPPHAAERFYNEASEGYLFFPSRFETLKRQELLIRAARHLNTPLAFLLAGDGGQREHCERLVAKLRVERRVHMLGRISEAEKRAFYAHSMGVYYGPRDEDYGYVTLEAMLAAKPVITCTDSGGPLELVQHQQTGLIVEPTPQAIAAAADRLYRDPGLAQALGRAGRQRYQDLGICWPGVVQRLLV